MGNGSKNLQEMANIMNSWGLYNIYNNQKFPIKKQLVHRIFTNKFYTGVITSTKYPEEVKGQHTPMITKELYYRVQGILEGRNTNIAVPLAKKIKIMMNFHCEE